MKIKREELSITLFVSILLIIAALPASAQQQAFFLWADEGQVDCDVFVEPYIQFDIYVFLAPSEEGAYGAEFKMDGPPNIIAPVSTELGPYTSGATLGTPYGEPGFSVAFKMCQRETSWVCRVTCLGASIESGYITLSAHDESQFCGVASCSGERPMVDCFVFGPFGYNYDGWCRFAVAESTWGAIKSLYR